MECKVKNEYGTIYIAEDVMLKVVGYAALECYGIVAMSGQRATDGIVEWLGRENLTKGVQIRNVGDMLDVDLYIIVEYGISISEVRGYSIFHVYNSEPISKSSFFTHFINFFPFHPSHKICCSFYRFILNQQLVYAKPFYPFPDLCVFFIFFSKHPHEQYCI